MSKSCFLSIRDLRRIRNTVDYPTAQTIATSLIHSQVDYCNSQFLNLLAVNLIAFNLFSTPLLDLFLKPLASAISHPSSNLYTGSKLISASSTKFSLSPTKHFNLKNLSISTAFSTFKLTLLLVRLLLSLFSVRQLTLVSKTDRSFTYHAPAFWNSLHKDLCYPLSQTSIRHLGLPIYHTTNEHLLALSASQFHLKLQTNLFLQSFQPS